MRCWLLRLRTVLATLAAVFLVWELPYALEMMATPRQGMGGEGQAIAVVRVWLCEEWTGTGMQWLTRQAAAFEKANRGVRVLTRRVQRGDWLAEGAVPPDVLLFDAYAMEDPEALAPLSGAYALKQAVQSAGVWRGVPYAAAVCYGGTVRIVNEEKPDATPLLMRSEADYQEFATQKAGILIATQREVARLAALAESGNGFPYRAEPYGDTTDRIVLAARFPAAGGRALLSEAFIAFLLSGSAQDALPPLGLLPAASCAQEMDAEEYPLLSALDKEIRRAANAFDEHPAHGVQ